MKQTTFSFPQIINRTSKKIEMSSNTQSINECLGILLRTIPGEMLGDPDWGCNLIERIFMFNGVVVKPLIVEDILNAIEAYEPRITVYESDIDIVQTDRSVQIYLNYTIKETGEVNEFNMEVTSDDNPFK